MSKQWLAFLAMALIALSGCTSDDGGSEAEPETTEAPSQDDTTPDTATNDETPSDAGETPQNGTVSADTAPSLNFTADVLSGPAPLTVNFTINITDAEGHAFAWSLDVNGDGQEDAAGQESAGFGYLYNAVNSYNATVTVTSTNFTQNATLTINVTEALPEGPCGAEPEPCVIENHPWATIWSNGQCDAIGAYGDPYYVQDRPGAEAPLVGGNPAGGDWPYGTGYLTGGGTWIYEESNGIPGLQLNDNLASLDSSLGADGFAVDKGCINGDTMVF